MKTAAAGGGGASSFLKRNAAINGRVNLITEPVLLLPKSFQHRKLKARPRRPSASNSNASASATATADCDSGANPRSVFVVFWSGGKDAYLSLIHVLEKLQLRNTKKRTDDGIDTDNSSCDPMEVILLTTFNAADGSLPHRGVHIWDIMNQAQHLELPLLAVPMQSRCTNNDYMRDVQTVRFHKFKS